MKLVSLSFVSTVAALLHPVIFIPGDGGSQLEAKLDKPSVVHYICDKKTDDYFSLWLNMELLMPIVIDCLIDNMRLIYDESSRTTCNNVGVQIRVPQFGNSSAVEWIDPSHASSGSYFNPVAEMLTTIGYRRDVSFRGAPYDFRKAPNELADYFVNLKMLVEETYVQNGNTSVVLIVHSLGALMASHFLRLQSDTWKEKYMKSMISLAGAWGGSVKAVKVYAVGDDLGVFILEQSVLKTEQVTSPSLAYLMPRKYLWNENEVLVQTEEHNYTLSDMRKFFSDIDYMNGWNMFEDTEPYRNEFSPPKVQLHCFHGTDIPTVRKLVYGKGAFPLGKPTLVYGNGDGTVNDRSLSACTHWSTMQTQPIHHQTFSKVDHMSILRSIPVLQSIRNILLSY